MRKEDKKAFEKYLKKLEFIKGNSNINAGETKGEQKERIQSGKRDYKFFVEEYFPHYATDECGDFHIKTAKKIKKKKRIRAVLKWARAHGKSVHADILIPLWLWVNNDMRFMVLISSTQDAADSLLSDLQAEFEANPLLIHDFGEQIQAGSWQEGDFTLKDGTRFAARGRGQKLRGLREKDQRPDLIVIDDIDDDELSENPKRVKKVIKWVLKAVLGLGDKGRFRIIIANNLISENSVTAHFSRQKKWVTIQVNAIDKNGKPTWYQKYTLDYLEELEEEMGSIAFRNEMMNDPTIEGDVFKAEETQYMPMTWKTLRNADYVVGYWDIAYTANKTSDYNAVSIVAFKGRKIQVFKIFCRQVVMDVALDWMHEVDKDAQKRGIIISWFAEKQFWNQPVIDAYDAAAKRHKEYLEIVTDDTRKTNKLVRILRLAFYWQTSKMFFNSYEKDTFDMQTGLAQLWAMEQGYSGKDDYPDSLEGAISKGKKSIVKDDADIVIGQNKKSAGAW